MSAIQLDVYALACMSVWRKRREDLTLTYFYLSSGQEVSHPAGEPDEVRARIADWLRGIAAGEFDALTVRSVPLVRLPVVLRRGAGVRRALGRQLDALAQEPVHVPRLDDADQLASVHHQDRGDVVLLEPLHDRVHRVAAADRGDRRGRDRRGHDGLIGRNALHGRERHEPHDRAVGDHREGLAFMAVQESGPGLADDSWDGTTGGGGLMTCPAVAVSSARRRRESVSAPVAVRKSITPMNPIHSHPKSCSRSVRATAYAIRTALRAWLVRAAMTVAS